MALVDQLPVRIYRRFALLVLSYVANSFHVKYCSACINWVAQFLRDSNLMRKILERFLGEGNTSLNRPPLFGPALSPS